MQQNNSKQFRNLCFNLLKVKENQIRPDLHKNGKVCGMKRHP